MRIFPKIKSIKLLYSFKSKIQKQKRFLNDIKFFFKNKIDTKYIILYTYSHFFKSKNKLDVWEYYENSTFADLDWFVEKTPIFINYFEKNKDLKKKIINILEIGSYEGRSSIFFLKYFIDSKLTCVDTWEGSDEHDKKNMHFIEQNFNLNTKDFSNRAIKIKNNSNEFFNKNNNFFDLIYIDGSHDFTQVMKDSINADKYLKKNGYLLFDDFNFIFPEYKKNENVAAAIKFFLDKFKNNYTIIYLYNQVLLKKK
jgi:SAM-dependent methyltransferase